MTDSEKWWAPALKDLAAQLSRGPLNEMRKRILTTRIKGEKLKLDEDTERMREFFEREIKRANTRKENMRKRLNEQSDEVRKLTEENEKIRAKLKKAIDLMQRIHKAYLEQSHRAEQAEEQLAVAKEAFENIKEANKRNIRLCVIDEE